MFKIRIWPIADVKFGTSVVGDTSDLSPWRRVGLFCGALVLIASFFSFYGVLPSSAATNVLTAPFNECPAMVRTAVVHT